MNLELKITWETETYTAIYY